jgi:hypothetical protein
MSIVCLAAFWIFVYMILSYVVGLLNLGDAITNLICSIIGAIGGIVWVIFDNKHSLPFKQKEPIHMSAFGWTMFLCLFAMVYLSSEVIGNYIYSHGLEFYDHGLFNFLGCIIILVIFIIALLPINFLIYLIKKKKIIIFFYIVFLIVFLFIYYSYISNFLGCKDWEKGLNNTDIENDINKYGCQIQKPKYCLNKFGKYFLDITKNSGIECGKELDTKEKLLKYSSSKNINKNTKRIGFPLTNKNSICLKRPDKKKKSLFQYIQVKI